MTWALAWIAVLAVLGTAAIFLLACVLLAVYDWWKLWRRMRR